MGNKNNITEVVFILDRSGSMSGLESDTIGGFNSMLKKQKALEGKAYVSTILFNQNSFVLHDRIDIENVPEMTLKDYEVNGTTALFDAIGSSIDYISKAHKYARQSEIPQKTVFIISTDGYENASQKYTQSDIKRLISNKKEMENWDFIFIGADMDATTSARNIGISGDFAASIENNKAGIQKCYEAINEAVFYCRLNQEAPLKKSWKKAIKR